MLINNLLKNKIKAIFVWLCLIFIQLVALVVFEFAR